MLPVHWIEGGLPAGTDEGLLVLHGLNSLVCNCVCRCLLSVALSLLALVLLSFSAREMFLHRLSTSAVQSAPTKKGEFPMLHLQNESVAAAAAADSSVPRVCFCDWCAPGSWLRGWLIRHWQ